MKAFNSKFFICVLLTSISYLPNSFALEQIGRLGVGTSNQFISGIPAISVKVQRSRSFALGALFGIDSNSTSKDYALGMKFYRILFDEPQLNFYFSGLFGVLKDYNGAKTSSGYQADLTFGSEFHFVGLESLGFSFEFGASVNKLHEGTAIQTAGYRIVTAGIHFYL